MMLYYIFPDPIVHPIHIDFTKTKLLKFHKIYLVLQYMSLDQVDLSPCQVSEIQEQTRNYASASLNLRPEQRITERISRITIASMSEK